MNENLEIAKNSIELAKGFLKSIVNPALSELGELFADNIRYLRFKNQVKILNRAEELVQKRNIKLRAIPLKVLVPMLENASLEEEESLQNRWAALIANAANYDKDLLSPVVYTSILNNLTHKEVIALDYLKEEGIITYAGLYKYSDISESQMDNLFRLKLIQNQPPDIEMDEVANYEFKMIEKEPKIVESEYILLTFLGEEFVNMCSLQ